MNRRINQVGLITCAALVIANMIGTGVFTSLGFQLAALSDPFAILGIWLLGGVFALCGAWSYAELASALPRSGGEYHFMGRVYHPALGFMAGIISIVAGFAAPVALSAMAFGEYFRALCPEVPSTVSASALVALVTTAHCINLSSSRNFQVAFTVLKVTLVGIFIGMGFGLPAHAAASLGPTAQTLPEVFKPEFAVSLMFAMYAYSGWNAATYIAGEVRAPQRTVAHSLVLGTLLVTVLYILLNAAFLYSTPAEALRGQLAIGRIAAEHLIGPAGGKMVAAFICLGLISAVSAMTWTGPRVYQVIGEDYAALKFLARRSAGGIPRLALVLQSSLVVIMIWSAAFESVLVFTQFALIACSLLTVVGVMVLRVRQPELERPFRVPLYPLPPVLFALIGIFTMGYSLKNNPVESMAGAAALGLALLLYPLARKKHP
ncbi:MAG TPA: amino acid permease [Chthoniobacterales bacterium]